MISRRFPAFCPMVCVACLALFGCSKSQTTDQSQNPAEPPAAAKAANPAAENTVVIPADSPQLKQIGIQAVKLQPVPSDEITAPAKIEVNPNRVSHALLPVPGRIVRVHAKFGDAVTQGQPLATVESPSIGEAESGYLQAEAAVRQAEVAASKADTDLSRSKELFDHGAVPSKDVQAAQSAAALAKSAVDQAVAAREQSRQRLELLGLKPGQSQQRVVVTAPISGKITEINAVEGEYHNEINASLFTVSDLSRVWVSSDVPESSIRFCRVGGLTELDLIAYPDEKFHARVTRIADMVDAETRTVKVTAELENPNGRLRPQMFGRLHYAGSTVAAVWAPESAVVQLGEKDAVFVEEAPGRFRATLVQLGKRHDTGFAILRGLSAGQRIVTSGTIYLKAGL